jgi:hypothetical protein
VSQILDSTLAHQKTREGTGVYVRRAGSRAYEGTPLFDVAQERGFWRKGRSVSDRPTLSWANRLAFGGGKETTGALIEMLLQVSETSLDLSEIYTNVHQDIL